MKVIGVNVQNGVLLKIMSLQSMRGRVLPCGITTYLLYYSKRKCSGKVGICCTRWFDFPSKSPLLGFSPSGRLVKICSTSPPSSCEVSTCQHDAVKTVSLHHCGRHELYSCLISPPPLTRAHLVLRDAASSLAVCAACSAEGHRPILLSAIWGPGCSGFDVLCPPLPISGPTANISARLPKLTSHLLTHQ